MVRTFTWLHTVRSYEGDAAGEMPPGGLLRLCEQIAVLAATDAGYDNAFHLANNSAWVVHRMTMLLDAPARLEDDLELTTWASHFTRVRGGREYRIRNLTTGRDVASALAEWVYVDRTRQTPKSIPTAVQADFDIPGAPLGTYDPPTVAPLDHPLEQVTERVADWHEVDSMRHVNNAVYADWLYSALWSALRVAGRDPRAMVERGERLRACYFDIAYRRAALPGDHVRIATRITALDGPLIEARQSILGLDNAEMVTAHTIYRLSDAAD
jgi:acyl-CoA thioesterase FadM